jgi:hypothetical protein
VSGIGLIMIELLLGTGRLLIGDGRYRLIDGSGSRRTCFFSIDFFPVIVSGSCVSTSDSVGLCGIV